MRSNEGYPRVSSRTNCAFVSATRLFLLLTAPLFFDHVFAHPCLEQAYGGTAQHRVSEKTAYDHGLLWRITRCDLEPSYLFGTIHVEDRRVTLLPLPVKEALEKSDSLISEVVMHPAAQAEYADSVRLEKKEELRRLIGDPIYRRLAAIARQDYGIPEQVLQDMKPWAVFTLLSRPRPVTGNTLDKVLEKLGYERRIPVYGLETIGEFVAVLDSMPMAQQIAVLEDTVRHHDRLVEMSSKLVDLYIRRDLAGMVALNSQPHEDEALHATLMDRILYQRNSRMVERMQAYLTQGRAFVAVGALHLPGKQGLLSLLEARGYHVIAVY